MTAISVGSGSQAAPNGVAGGASADDLAIRTELPANPHRPQVYLAYHGSEGLLGNNDHQWPFVRQHLDGVWGNPFSPAGVGTDGSLNRTIELTSKLRTRKLIVEHPIANGAGCEGFRDDWYWAEVERRSNIRYDRVAAAVYAGQNPDCWGPAGGITAGFDTYRRQGYDTVYTLFQPQNLSTQVNAGAFPTIRPGSAGDVAYRNSGGVVLECPIDACTDPTFGAPFFQAIQEAHARNVPFVWFTGFSTSYGIGRSGWLQRVQHQYNAVAAMGLWRPDDAIVLINYDGYRALPERNADGSPADTTAGILAWLLEQRPVQTLCPDRVSC
ncbi:MAG: hypothetical protein AAFP84_12255 [Actinomycetota bacterium]